LFTWGDNQFGELGDGTTVLKSSPVQIGSSSWTAVAGNGYHTVAIRLGGSLFTWGNNPDGQLGDNTGVNKSSPVQIGSSSWTVIATQPYQNNSLAIRVDGALFAWGYNGQGNLGDGTTLNKWSPVQIGSSSWTAVALGICGAAIRSDGALFTWGYNGEGELGDGTTVNRSSPVQIGSSSWTAVAAGYVHTAAIRLDGALFTWGWNANGNLGNGTTVHRSSPVQLPAMIVMIHRSSPIQIGTGSWSQITAGNQFIYGLTNNNILYGWGLNSSGQIGWNNTITRSSPTQLSSN
jgi:alpha-tubulin suppressor-like RCC1 family protein